MKQTILNKKDIIVSKSLTVPSLLSRIYSFMKRWVFAPAFMSHKVERMGGSCCNFKPLCLSGLKFTRLGQNIALNRVILRPLSTDKQNPNNNSIPKENNGINFKEIVVNALGNFINVRSAQFDSQSFWALHCVIWSLNIFALIIAATFPYFVSVGALFTYYFAPILHFIIFLRIMVDFWLRKGTAKGKRFGLPTVRFLRFFVYLMLGSWFAFIIYSILLPLVLAKLVVVVQWLSIFYPEDVISKKVASSNRVVWVDPMVLIGASLILFITIGVCLCVILKHPISVKFWEFIFFSLGMEIMFLLITLGALMGAFPEGTILLSICPHLIYPRVGLLCLVCINSISIFLSQKYPNRITAVITFSLSLFILLILGYAVVHIIIAYIAGQA